MHPEDNAKPSATLDIEESKEPGSFGGSVRFAPAHLKKWAIVIVGGAIMITIGLSIFRHVSVAKEAERREAEAKAGPRVRVATVVQSKGERLLTLTGETKPFSAVTLYAKVSGYLKEVRVDKGDKVKAGQILAVIEAPETEKAFEGAQADSKNKNSISERMIELRKRNLVSPQEADQAASDAAVAKSRLDSLAVQKSYETLRAPFSGTITSRFADPGSLMQNATNSQTSALPVVAISSLDHLRIYAYVDQRDASFVAVGQPVTITLTERPGVEISAKVSRMSGELDSKTRMLLTEIDLDNLDSNVVSGSFVNVVLKIKTPSFLQLPSEALIVQGEKYLIPVVRSDNKLSFHEVKIADNDGKTVRLLSGVEAGDTVALNIGSTIADGTRVRPIVVEAAKGIAAPAAPSMEHKSAGQPANGREPSAASAK